MSDRIETEALMALVNAQGMHDDRGVLCVTSVRDDQSWGMSISICEPCDTDKIVKSLAAEVLEYRASEANTDDLLNNICDERRENTRLRAEIAALREGRDYGC